MMHFHLLRPYKAPEKHPLCCWMCERVCVCCVRGGTSETLLLLPSMHRHGSPLEEACELWTRQNTPTRFQKTKEGSKHGRMQPPSAWLKKHSTFPERKNRLWTLFSLYRFYEWVQAESMSLIVTQWKRGRQISFPSFIDLMNDRAWK